MSGGAPHLVPSLAATLLEALAPASFSSRDGSLRVSENAISRPAARAAMFLNPPRQPLHKAQGSTFKLLTKPNRMARRDENTCAPSAPSQASFGSFAAIFLLYA